VPRNSKPVRRQRRSGAAAAIVVVLVCGVIYLILRPSTPAPPLRATGCEADPGGLDLQLSPGQAGIAATIAGVASRRALPTRAVAIAYATALQESKLANLHYGDRDSVGVFQQRPSEGWGSTEEIEDPVYATGRFFDALTAVPNYLGLPIYAAAQDVQHSADGSAYGQYAGMGTALATAFTGMDPHAVWCSYAGVPGKPRLAAASEAMTRAFGLVGTPASRRMMSIQVSQEQLGWAVATWLVSNAAAFGISSVLYGGYQWSGFTGTGQWAAASASARAAGATALVEFG
jgi:hypothetical protein